MRWTEVKSAVSVSDISLVGRLLTASLLEKHIQASILQSATI